MPKPKPTSEHSKRLARIDKKIAEQKVTKKALEDAQATQKKNDTDQMQKWLEMVKQMELKEKEAKKKKRPAPSPERLKAMAKRFHMATSSQEEHERMYIQLLLDLINNLDEEPREEFNRILADLWKAKYE